MTTESPKVIEQLSQFQLLLHGKPTTDLTVHWQQDFFLPSFKMWQSAAMKHEPAGGQKQKLLVKTTVHKGQNCNEVL